MPMTSAYVGSRACSASMNAARPPSFCVSAMICRARVVLPLDSGPKISMTRPLGTPPTPRARSSARAPVEIEATLRYSSSPMRTIEPLPNWRSICDTAAPIALFLSCTTLRSVTRYPPPFLAPTTCSSRTVLVIIRHEYGIYYGKPFFDSGSPKEQWLVTLELAGKLRTAPNFDQYTPLYVPTEKGVSADPEAGGLLKRRGSWMPGGGRAPYHQPTVPPGVLC